MDETTTDPLPVPCVVCKKVLQPVFKNQEDDGGYVQPDGASTLSGRGNYGSEVFDPMDGSYVLANICDECMTEALADGRVKVYRDEVTRRTTQVR